MIITSPQNTKIKHLIKLQQKSRERKKTQSFVVEGVQENKLALKNDFEPLQFFIDPTLFTRDFTLPSGEVCEVTREVFEKIAYRKTTGGIIGVYKTKTFGLQDIKKENPLIVILEEVEKPGNLGAILRSCDATNADAVIICDERVDFFNPNVVRSSVGTLFSNTLISVDKEELVSFCRERGIQLLATYLRDDTENLYAKDLSQGTGLVFGTESTGLSDFWLHHVDATIKIPMLGQVDSLNVSNAVVVCLYEAVRQRL